MKVSLLNRPSCTPMHCPTPTVRNRSTITICWARIRTTTAEVVRKSCDHPHMQSIRASLVKAANLIALIREYNTRPDKIRFSRAIHRRTVGHNQQALVVCSWDVGEWREP